MKKVQILGTGCKKCEQLTANAKQAIATRGADAEVVKVTDLSEIMGFGVMVTPALAIDGEVKFAGRVASADEIAKLL